MTLCVRGKPKTNLTYIGMLIKFRDVSLAFNDVMRFIIIITIIIT